MALIAVAFSGHAQQHLERGHEPMGGGRGFFGAPSFPRGGQGGYHPGYQAPPAGRYAPPGYPAQHMGPPANYPPYGSPYRAPAMGGEWRNQEDFLRQGVRQGQLAPLGRVIENIRRVTPGRQLDAGLEYLGPRLVYRVRWMTPQGRRMDYYVDATSGAILPGR